MLSIFNTYFYQTSVSKDVNKTSESLCRSRIAKYDTLQSQVPKCFSGVVNKTTTYLKKGNISIRDMYEVLWA